MAKGKIIYFNKADKSEEYFASIGYKVPEFSNPADYYMAMMSIESYDVEDSPDQGVVQKSKTVIQEEYSQKIQWFYDEYEWSALKCDADEVDPNAPPLGDQKDIITYKANFCKQYFLILIRAMRNLIRIPLASYVKIITTIIVSLMIILIF